MATLSNSGTGQFASECPANTIDLLVGKHAMGLYLQAKMAMLLGKRADEVLLGTPFNIPAQYNNSEGVIVAMVDREGWVKGLRIDLQKFQTVASHRYATFQIQYGTGMGANGGAYAGALVRVDTIFSVGDLREALTRSFISHTYWQVDP